MGFNLTISQNGRQTLNSFGHPKEKEKEKKEKEEKEEGEISHNWAQRNCPFVTFSFYI